jgi:predicted small secreted protein
MKRKTLLISALLIAMFAITACSDNNNPAGNDDVVDNSEIAYKYIMQVGEDKEFKTIKAASLAAKDSTLIEVDAGTYSGDVADWTQHELYIRAVGGEVVLDAAGKNVDDMGIWKIRDGKIKVEGFTFINAKVKDKNGAGIRLIKGDLIVVNCRFFYNETGILTGNVSGTLTLRNCEFGWNGYSDGQSHNLYVGRIDKLFASGCYFHHANVGHLLKSRARQSVVVNCRLTDESDDASTASYEMNFPDGGMNIVVGNIIQQSPKSPNTTIISFAEEHINIWTENELYMAFNTIINGKASTNNAIFAPSTLPNSVYLYNNLFSKNAALNASIKYGADINNHKFNNGDLNSEYAPSQALFNELKGKIDLNIDNNLPANIKSQGISLIPTAEYKHLCKTNKLNSKPMISGAIQTAD